MDPSRFALPPAAGARETRGATSRLRDFFLRRWTGRFILASVLVAAASIALPLPDWVAGPAWIVTVLAMAYACARVAAWILRRLLWRIRTKMILSYLFIALAPVCLLVLFFCIAGLLGLMLVASYAVASHVERAGRELLASSRGALAALPADAPGAVRTRLQPLRADHPHLAFALFRDGKILVEDGSVPRTLPAWLPGPGFAGLVRDGEAEWLRAVWTRDRTALLLQVPVDEALFAGLRDRTGVRVLSVGGYVETKDKGLTVKVEDDQNPSDVKGRPINLPGPPEPWGFNSGALVEQRSWPSGDQGLAPMAIRFHPPTLLRRLSPGTLDLGDIYVKILLGLGASFVVLYFVPLFLGLLLARSITRSVHELSRGTAHLRAGDFRHQIPVRSRDQLGELADSFNVMARGIEDLLREQSEKQRLEEELRIARQIQMSLLPRDSVCVPGLEVAGACLPAAEVGGDYYDLLPLAPSRLGVLVADVSGKGTSAALYMAELKGLVLSLSRIHESPHRLLSEANRILAATMDVRSFITMTYAVVDVEARVMRFARAGHNPLLRVPAAEGRAQVLSPPGMGLGMDRGDRFDALLEEMEVPLLAGDLFLFFTDGLSEAMDSGGALFGEERLAGLLQQAPAATAPEAVKEEVLGEVKRFVGDAPQHDDMTMVVLRVV
jgi:sigma-B regulation protein RsbU (phosphoserine phosphatase)